MNKEPQQILLLSILLIAGLAYAYYTYLFMPQWAEIQRLRQICQEGRSRYAFLLEYKERNASLYGEVARLEVKYHNLKNQVPQKIDKPKLVVDLYTLAKMNQVQPQNITFGDFQVMDSYATQSLTLSCLGTQQGIINMINGIQLLEEQKFTLESLNFTNEGGLFNGEIHLTAYAATVSSL